MEICSKTETKYGKGSVLGEWSRAYLINRANMIKRKLQTRLDHFCAYERDLRRQVKLAEVQSQVLQQKMAALEMANERIKAQIHTEQDDESPVDPNVELKKRVEIQRATLTEQRRLTEIKTLELRRLDEQKAADDCIINKEIREASDATDLYRAQSAEEWSAFCNALQNDLKARQDFVDIELRKERRRIQQVHSGCRELSRTDQLRFDEDQKARAMTIHKLRITRERLRKNIEKKQRRGTVDAGALRSGKTSTEFGGLESYFDRSKTEAEQALLELIEEDSE